MNIRHGGWIHRLLRHLAIRASEAGNSLKMLKVAIDNAFQMRGGKLR